MFCGNSYPLSIENISLAIFLIGKQVTSHAFALNEPQTDEVAVPAGAASVPLAVCQRQADAKLTLLKTATAA